MPLEHSAPIPLHHAAHRLAWSRVLTLAVAAFIFNTTEFIPIALLSDIGAGFGMSAAQTGVMLTVYAWVVSLASLPCMLLLARQERRALLLALFTLFIASHAVSALAWNFGVLLVSRIGVALAHAVFWAITTALVVRLAPPGNQQQAIGWLSMGTALATVLGLPLGRLIGQVLGWRTTFALIAVAAAAVMLAVFLLLPRLPSRNAGSVTSLPLLARRPLLLGLYAFTALIIAAHFTAYSYIEPFARQFSHLGEGATTAHCFLSLASPAWWRAYSLPACTRACRRASSPVPSCYSALPCCYCARWGHRRWRCLRWSSAGASASPPSASR